MSAGEWEERAQRAEWEAGDLEEDVSALRAEHARLQNEKVDLLVENKRLRTALEPLAAKWGDWMEGYDEHEKVRPEYTRFTYGQLLRANAALEPWERTPVEDRG